VGLGGSSPRSKLFIGLGIDPDTMEVFRSVPGPGNWNAPCLGRWRPGIGGGPPEAGEVPVTAGISAEKPVCVCQQDNRMDLKGDDSDISGWEDPPQLFAKDPGTAKVVDASRSQPDGKVAGADARRQDEPTVQIPRDSEEVVSDLKKLRDGVVVIATPGGSQRLWARGSANFAGSLMTHEAAEKCGLKRKPASHAWVIGLKDRLVPSP
jgi:hypothetical protein